MGIPSARVTFEFPRKSFWTFSARFTFKSSGNHIWRVSARFTFRFIKKHYFWRCLYVSRSNSPKVAFGGFLHVRISPEGYFRILVCTLHVRNLSETSFFDVFWTFHVQIQRKRLLSQSPQMAKYTNGRVPRHLLSTGLCRLSRLPTRLWCRLGCGAGEILQK